MKQYRMVTLPTDDKFKSEIRIAAAKLGLSQAGFLRAATKYYLQKIEREGVKSELSNQNAPNHQ